MGLPTAQRSLPPSKGWGTVSGPLPLGRGSMYPGPVRAGKGRLVADPPSARRTGRLRVAPLAKLGVGITLGVSLLVSVRPARTNPEAPTLPNIVFILTDDQRWDTLWAMPNVQSELVSHGVDFRNTFVVNSLCCPSRVSILTGQYSHTTLVYKNGGRYGGFEAFHGDDSTVATWLSGGGYRTGLIGKYLNGYDLSYTPPGWTYWAAFQGAPNGGAYYDYDLNVNGTLLHYGHTPEDYSTAVLASYAGSFIRDTDPGQPLFLYLSFKAPHIPPTPAPKYGDAFSDLQPYRPPNYNEGDVSDKPAWVRALRPLSAEDQASIDEQRKDQYRTLLSVDDAVDTVVAALTDTGRLSNTLIVFTSDNGWAWGEHRWNNKKVAFEESIRVPMIVRYDPLVPAPRTDDHLMTNIDFAPTFAEVAGVSAPDVEGLSMMPLIESPTARWRADFLVEHLLSGPGPPTFCAVRNEGYLYVRYLTTREEELYDLNADFYELSNVVTDPSYSATLHAMRRRLALLCDPPPPRG